jgi:hypothetical protein
MQRGGAAGDPGAQHHDIGAPLPAQRLTVEAL